jgi:hypothetical protein
MQGCYRPPLAGARPIAFNENPEMKHSASLIGLVPGSTQLFMRRIRNRFIVIKAVFLALEDPLASKHSLSR